MRAIASFVAIGFEKATFRREKPTPVSVSVLIRAVGTREVDLSLEMAGGLTPVLGKLITEKEAIELLGEVTCLAIGRKGSGGGEGSATILVEGKRQKVKKVYDRVISVKAAEVNGIAESLPECTFPHEKGSAHLGCVYKRGKAFRKYA